MLNNAWSVWFAHQRPWSSSKRMNFNDFSKRKTFSFHAYALCFTCILFDDVLNMKPRFFLLFSSLAKFGVSFNFDEEMWERQNTFFTWQRSHGRWKKRVSEVAPFVLLFSQDEMGINKRRRFALRLWLWSQWESPSRPLISFSHNPRRRWWIKTGKGKKRAMLQVAKRQIRVWS